MDQPPWVDCGGGGRIDGLGTGCGVASRLRAAAACAFTRPGGERHAGKVARLNERLSEAAAHLRHFGRGAFQRATNRCRLT